MIAMTGKKNTHVAWADRLGLNKQWMNDIGACSMSHGAEDYINQVDRFRNDIINIKDGPQLYDIINNKWEKDIMVDGNNLFNQWIEQHLQDSRIDEERTAAQDKIRAYQAEKLYHFIIQTLENTGFGFYKSDIIDEDYSDDSTDSNNIDDDM
jgi:hypothetical protein